MATEATNSYEGSELVQHMVQADNGNCSYHYSGMAYCVKCDHYDEISNWSYANPQISMRCRKCKEVYPRVEWENYNWFKRSADIRKDAVEFFKGLRSAK